MFSRVLSFGLQGIDCFPVSVEADIGEGMPVFELVGFLSGEVREARERVRTALKNCGVALPVKRITVNLSPASVRKQGTGFDLPVAVSILEAMGILDEAWTNETVFVGELQISGKIGGVSGVLPIVIAAKKHGAKRCIIPYDNLSEGSQVDGIKVYGIKTLPDVIDFLMGDMRAATQPPEGAGQEKKSDTFDFSMVHGQRMAKRGLEIAAAGNHNVIMVGEPGTGKTLLAKCVPSIMPPLTMEECLEVSAIYSIAGKLSENHGLITERPFVQPHHTITDKALSGGGTRANPGCVSLAHRGVLFLDEMPEFSRNALEILRQPLEDRCIHISRCGINVTYPSDVMLIGAMNPCPCGAYPNLNKCRCTEAMRRRYVSRISKPLLDRIDLCMEVSAMKYEELFLSESEEPSSAIRERVSRAHRIQTERFADYPQIFFNAQMGIREIEQFCRLTNKASKLMTDSYNKLELSVRGYHKLLKVARTIADLCEEECINEYHLAEALHYRMNMEG